MYNGLNTVKMWDEKKSKYRSVRTFVLKDGTHAMIHIPVEKVMNAIDYKRLKNIEAKGGEMLTKMRDTTLSNGMNALSLYDELIEIYDKPEEQLSKNDTQAQQQAQPVQTETTEVVQESAQPQKRKRGRPRKNSQ